MCRADDVDSLKHLDSLYAPDPWDGGCFGGCAPMPIEGKCPQPDYPEKARQDSVEGKVYVWVHVDTSGCVKEWQLIQEKPEGYGFGQATEQVIVKWEFTPCIESGRPKSNWIAIPFKFKLPK